MGFPSCYENNLEQYYDSLHMRGPAIAAHVPKPLYIASPPLQPAKPIPAPQPQLDAAAIEKRRRALFEKNVLGMAELLPGSRWRH